MKISNLMGSSLIVAVTFLTGCASSFLDTKSTTPLTCNSNLVSDLAAKCIRDNANNRSLGGFFALPIEQLDRPNVFQVHVRSPVGAAAIFEIEPAVNGSLVTGWISNHFSGVREKSMNIYTENCCLLRQEP